MDTLLNWIWGRRVQTFRLGNDDIVVFVVGPSGCGKSLFVEEVTRSNFIRVGRNLRPCTTRVKAVRCELTERARAALGDATQRSIVFIDTPSFHTGRNDQAAEREMTKWLNKSRSRSTLVGTIYMHRVETDPRHEPVQPHLNTFARTFPANFLPLPQRVHAVLSYEGVITEDRTGPRMTTLQGQLEALGPCLGGRLRWVASLHPNLFQSGDPDTAWQAVVALFS